MNVAKLQELAKQEGYEDIDELIAAAASDECDYGICTNKDCDYTTNVEPDSDSGWCEECETNTVAHALRLAGLI